MVDFRFTPEQEELRQRARRVVAEQMQPLLAEHDPSAYLPDAAIHELFRQAQTVGYLGALVRRARGGAGYGHVELGLLLETFAPVFGFLAAHIMPGLLDELGTDEHRAKYLPSLLGAEQVGTILMTEPDAGSNAAGLRMSARRDGDEYVLNGAKRWILLGGVARIAAAIVATDPSAGGKGLSILLVELEPGRYECERIKTVGMRRIPIAELRFSGYRVPVANRIGAEGEGLRLTLARMGGWRASPATQAVGLAQAAVDAAIDYAKKRQQFGRPIGGFQLVQGLIAEMLAETEAARLLAYRVWTMLDRGEECSREASLAKLFATEAAVRVTSKAIQIHGANGLAEEYPVAQYFRDARMLTFPDGTSEIHKLIVGRATLGISAFA